MLYYIPAVEQPTPERIANAGLSYAFEGKPLAAPVTRGPCDGPGGVILCDVNLPGSDRLGYYEHEQAWRKIPGAKSMTEHGTVCVGMWNEESLRPTPEQLARRSQLPGHPVELADGREWLCPMAIAWQGSEPAYPLVALPRAAECDDDGNWTDGGVLPAYRELWDVADWWQTQIATLADDERDAEEDIELELTMGDVFDRALACLAANYRLGRAEVSLLGLFTELHAARVLTALLDDAGYKSIRQKKTGS